MEAYHEERLFLYILVEFKLNLQLTNEQLKNKTPFEIVRWAVSLSMRTIVTTNFGPYEAVILHLIHRVKSDMDVVWIDSGYNTRATYVNAEKLIELFNLKIHVFNPLMSAKRRDTLMNGIPNIESELHEKFTYQVKLEPFKRAIDKFKPQIWLTAIRKEQTSFREKLDIVTSNEKGLIKIAPLFYTSEQQMQNYLKENNLPDEQDYYDPTKVVKNRECGLHKNFLK